MSLPIIQSLWIGDDLTNLEKLCIQSFIDHGHEFHLYTYADIGGVPDGTTIKDGNDILHGSKVYKDRRGSYATFSDWFRYEMLAAVGGFWVDTDAVCVKPFDFKNDLVVGKEDSENVCNAVVGSPKDHKIIVAMRDACREYPKINRGWHLINFFEQFFQVCQQFVWSTYIKPPLAFFQE